MAPQPQDTDASDITTMPGLRFGKRATLFQLRRNKDNHSMSDLQAWFRRNRWN